MFTSGIISTFYLACSQLFFLIYILDIVKQNVIDPLNQEKLFGTPQ